MNFQYVKNVMKITIYKTTYVKKDNFQMKIVNYLNLIKTNVKNVNKIIS